MAAKADVKYEVSEIQPGEIAEAISDMGFPSEVMEDTMGGKGESKIQVLRTRSWNIILVIWC